jgi:Protein of unknown function (DUF541)
MNVDRRHPARALFALTAALLVLVIGAATAFGRGAPSPSGTSSGAGGVTGVSAPAIFSSAPVTVASAPDAMVGSGIAMPTWCCGGTSGAVPGLTTTGSANMDGQGQAARDAAITAAVKDATAQANVAATAAGINLGALIDMQVSAMPSYYSMGEASGAPVPATGAPGTVGATPSPAPDTYYGSVTVTMTWSLG